MKEGFNPEGGHVFPFNHPVELNAGMTLRTHIAVERFLRLTDVEVGRAAKLAVEGADALIRELQLPYKGDGGQ